MNSLLWLHGLLSGVILGSLLHNPIERYVCRPIRCRLKTCPGKIIDTDYGISWQCNRCGKISGWMSNKTIRETTKT